MKKVTTAEWENAQEILSDALADFAQDEALTETAVSDIACDMLGVYAERDEIRSVCESVDVVDGDADRISGEICNAIFDIDENAVRDRLNELWDNNAFGNIDDFDRDNIEREAAQLLAHWRSMGWAPGVYMTDVAEFLAEKIAEIDGPTPQPPTLRDMVAAAGYYHHIAVDRLTVALRAYPGCADLSTRNLQNYLAGATRIPASVGIALSRLLGVDLETILRGSK